MSAAYFWVNEPFDSPVTINMGGLLIPVAPALSFWTDKSDDDMGLVSHAWVKYDYSDDFWVKVGWEHFFTGDAMQDGSFQFKNGLEFAGGKDDEDADYIYFDTQLKF